MRIIVVRQILPPRLFETVFPITTERERQTLEVWPITGAESGTKSVEKPRRR